MIKRFQDFLKENLSTAHPIIINDEDRKKYFDFDEGEKAIALINYERFKLNNNINMLDVFYSYKINTINLRIWNTGYVIEYVRFLIYKVDDYLHLFAFDGEFTHHKVAYFLYDKKINKSLHIDYQDLYSAFIYDTKKLNSLDLKTENWCLPLTLDKKIEIQKIQMDILINKNIHEFFGINKDEFNNTSKFKFS